MLDCNRIPHNAGDIVCVNDLGAEYSNYDRGTFLNVLVVASDGLIVTDYAGPFDPTWVFFKWVNPEGCGDERDKSVWHLCDVPACGGPGEVAGACEDEMEEEFDGGPDVPYPGPTEPPEFTQYLPTDPKVRKGLPLYSGLLRYFPRALIAVAELSRIGNDQHNPGQPLHWDRSKSGDHLDALLRHTVDAGTVDTDGVRHSAKVAWRALANLEQELES